MPGVKNAVQHIRRMRGGAQAHLMRADDDCYYVVKFQNNPQHPRVLANELLASRLASEIGLPVPAAAIVDVKKWLVDNTPELTILLAGRSIPCEPGRQFGSRYVADPAGDFTQVLDFLPDTMFDKVKDLHLFGGILAFDKWTANANGRQAAFWKRGRERKYTVSFIDHGYCFNAGEWSFADSPLRGVFPRNQVYTGITGWDSFEPWLSRIEALSRSLLDSIADEIPTEWYGDRDDLSRLLEELWQRRSHVRRLIEDFRESRRAPFPHWKYKAAGYQQSVFSQTGISGC